MDYVRRHGYPVPEVFGVDGPSMELERIEGPALLDLVAHRPHRIGAFAGLLADLHHQLRQIPAPSSLASPFGRGGCVLHLDLQPANVVMARRGAVVLDWGWAAAGPPEADNTHTWLQLETSEIPGSAPIRLVATLGRRMFIRQFLRRFDLVTLRGARTEVSEYRLGVRELTGRERRMIEEFVGRAAPRR